LNPLNSFCNHVTLLTLLPYHPTCFYSLVWLWVHFRSFF